MNQIDLTTETKKIISLFTNYVDTAKHLFKRVYFLEDVKDIITKDDKKTITDEIEEIEKLFSTVAEHVYEYLLYLENNYGEGWADFGAPAALKLMAEGDTSIKTLDTFISNYKTIIEKLILLDTKKALLEGVA